VYFKTSGCFVIGGYRLVLVALLESWKLRNIPAAMIESHYWKQDLRDHAKRLRPVDTPPRWSERAVVNFEKELMVSFFMVRALLERDKLSSKVKGHKVKVFRYPWSGKRVTKSNFHSVDNLYALDAPEEAELTVNFLSNQFIHSRALYAMRDGTRNWASVLLCSDHERAKAIYLVQVQEIQRIFHLVATDNVHQMSMTYDEKLGDYRVTTN
jgi:hypothetical protein